MSGWKQRAQVGQIYLIADEDAGLLKIGFSGSPHSRLASLRTERKGSRLHLVGILKDNATLNTERWYHRRFGRLRVEGEWFRDDPAIRAFVKPNLLATARRREERIISVRFNQELFERVKIVAQDEGRSLGNAIVHLVHIALDNRQKGAR
jgi:hypothetical protein